MKLNPARILAVTAGLVAGGALFGALASVIAVTLVMALLGGGEGAFSLFQAAARMGAVLGAVLLPIAGWTLLRRVPLWQTLTGTIVGTVIGGILGTGLGFLAYPLGMMVGPPLGATIGFLLAAIRLRRRYPAMAVAERIRVPRGAEA